MPGYRGKKTNRHRDVTGVQIESEREDQWGEMTGVVQSFDAAAQSATIRPDYMRRLNGEARQIPDLLEVPVRFPRMGGFVVTTPVREGDRVTLRPQMRNAEQFHVEGGSYATEDTRSASLSDYEAFLDGGEPLTQPISEFNNSNLEIRSEDGRFKFEMSEDGRFRITGSDGNWFDLLAQGFERLATDTLIITRGSSAGNGHQLEHQSVYADIAARLRAMAL